MRMVHSSMLLFALTCVLPACGDTGEGANDSQESLRRGHLADGGAVHHARGDEDADSDEDAEEALTEDAGRGGRGARPSDGGARGHDDEDDARGDGGCWRGRGWHRGRGRGHGHGHGNGPTFPFGLDGGTP